MASASAGEVAVANTGVIGDVTIHAGGGLTAADIAVVHPEHAAEELAAMGMDRGARLLAAADPEASAAVVAVMATDRAVRTVTVMHPAKAERMLDHLAGDIAVLLRHALTARDAIRAAARTHATSLGTLTSPLAHAPGSEVTPTGFRQDHASGAVLWTAGTGAQPVWGEIAAYHATHVARLGYPCAAQTEAVPSPKGTVGVYQRFEHGSVHWTSRYGAHATCGPIGELYVQLGGTAGLGFPTSEEFAIRPPSGQTASRQDFEGGRIYWSEGYGAHVVQPRIFKAFPDPAPRVPGNPLIDELPIGAQRELGTSPFGTEGVCQPLDWDTTVYSSLLGSFRVVGPIGALHRERGGATGELGFPTGAEKAGRQEFEGGIAYRVSSDAYAVTGRVRELLADPKVAKQLGAPYGNLDRLAGAETVQVQLFANGVVTVRGRARPEYWVRPPQD